jgi:hypothetical protein
MYKTDSNNEVHVCIGSMVEIAQIRRTIAHMGADIAFHQNQMRLFEKLLQEQQVELENLESSDHENCA